MCYFICSYIYTDKINLLPTDVFDIWYLSKKYIIPRLTRKCIEYLHINLTPDNTCLILDQSLIYEEETLILKCLKMIQAYTEATLKSKTMLNMRIETLMKILDCDILSITETDVFNACVRWAIHQLELKHLEASGENIRNVLGDCIRKIGYANMGLRKFSSIVAPLGILNPKEENAILRYMSNKDVHHPPTNFICTKRDRIFPLAMIFYDQLLLAKERLSDMNIKVTMTSKIDIEIQSVFVGLHRKINELHFDNNALNISSKLKIDDKMEEWKFDSPIILHKDQQHALVFTDRSYFMCDVYVVKRSEIVADDNIVEIQLKSSASFMPLLGFRYTLAIPE